MTLNMTPGLRKAALAAHVSCSVGLLGAIAAFLALALLWTAKAAGAACADSTGGRPSCATQPRRR